MTMRSLKPLMLAATLAVSSQASAVSVVSGQTNVLLDTPLLASVGLSLSGVGGPVIAPGNLGPDSVAFPINGRDAAAPALPTTFSFTAGTLAPFSGTIEHMGTVLFNGGALEVGNFTIGFDAGRAGAATSGFFVADNVTFAGVPLFDVGIPSALTATGTWLTVAANLLVSSELAGVLGNADLTGVDVGDALVEAVAVPEPGTLSLVLAGLLLGGIAVSRRSVRTAAASGR
jgi:hypothetical protein